VNLPINFIYPSFGGKLEVIGNSQMQFVSCKVATTLSGMTRRSRGFSIDRESLLQSKCASSGHLEESEKTAGVCMFCQYNIISGNK
jgi:hypothetical protein